MSIKGLLASTCSVVVLAGGTHAATMTSSATTLSFSTQGQNLWGTEDGSEPLASFTYSIDLVDVERNTVGGFSDVTNPQRAVWQSTFDREFNKAFNDNYDTIRDQQIQRVIADDPVFSRLCPTLSATFCPANTIRNIADPIARPIVEDIARDIANDIAGPPPPGKALQGAEITYEAQIDYSLIGEFGFADATVDARYDAEANTTLTKTAGDIVEVKTEFGDEKSQLDTEFGSLVARIDQQLDVLTFLEAETRYATSGGSENETNTILDIDQSVRDPLYGIVGNEDEVELTFAGESISTGSGAGFRKTFFLGTNGEVVPFIGAGVPLAEVAVKFPSMDLFSVADAGMVEASISPVPRLGVESSVFDFPATAPPNSDVLRAEVDIDGIVTAQSGLPFGAALEVSAPGVVLLRVEGNAIDLDLATYFSLGQSVKFTANPSVIYEFSEPVQLVDENGDPVGVPVLQAPDEGGKGLRFIHPATEGFTVTPVFDISRNAYEQEVSGFLDFTYETDWLQIILEGLLLPTDIDLALLSTVLPLNPNPIRIFNLPGDDNFSLGGFETVRGSAIGLPSKDGGGDQGPPTIAPVPLPPAGAALLAGLGLMGWVRRRNHSSSIR